MTIRAFRAGRRLAVLAAAGLTASSCGTADPGPVPTPSPTEAVASALPSATASSTTSPTETLTDAATTDPTDVESEHDATDTDRARFVAEYRPDGATDIDHVQVDLDADGVEEVVVFYVRPSEGVGHVDLAFWSGTDYEVVAGADGGVADRVQRVRVADLNADGRTEIALFVARGSSGASVTLWAVAGERLVPLTARGGCHDGSATYGVIGATIEDRDRDGRDEIYATCDDSPVPVAAWSTDGYSWTDGAWRHDPELASQPS